MIKQIFINSSDDHSVLNFKFNLNVFRSVDAQLLKNMRRSEFKNWFESIKNNDYQYIKNLKFYGFRLLFDKESLYFKNNQIYPPQPWEKNFKKQWLGGGEIKVASWLFSKNKNLYRLWRRQTNNK